MSDRQPATLAAQPLPCRTIILLIATLATLWFSGCQVNQKAEVAQYRKILDRRVPPAPQYKPGEMLTLVGAMELASEADESLASRGEDYVQALIDKNRALANFLPTVSFQPSFVVAQPAKGAAAGGSTLSGHTAALGPVSTGLGAVNLGTTGGAASASSSAGTGAFRSINSDVVSRLEAPVVGSINVFRGFGDVANLDVAKLDIEWRKQLMLDLQDTILLNTAQGYYQVLRSQAQVVVLQNSLKVQEARVQLVQNQFKNKLATRLAVAQSEAQADATHVTLLQAQSDVRNGRSTLAYLIGVPAVSGALADNFVPPATHPPVQAYDADAYRLRRDVLAAQYNTRAARRAVDVYFAQYFPSVSLNVAGFLYREYFSDATKWDAILSANLPIFSAGLIDADVKAAWSRLRQAALAEEALHRSVAHDVELAYENLTTAENEIRELEGEVAAAAEALRQAQSAYENGLAINLDVLTAQDALLNAQLALTGVRYDRIIYFLDLLRVTGTLQSLVAKHPIAPATQPTTH